MELEAENSDRIGSVMAKLHNHARIPVLGVLLAFRGRVLSCENDGKRTLAEIGFTDGDFMVVLYRAQQCKLLSPDLTALPPQRIAIPRRSRSESHHKTLKLRQIPIDNPHPSVLSNTAAPPTFSTPSHKRRRITAPDTFLLHQLTSMGFQRSLATQALLRTDNSLEAALNWLVERPAAVPPAE